MKNAEKLLTVLLSLFCFLLLLTLVFNIAFRVPDDTINVLDTKIIYETKENGVRIPRQFITLIGIGTKKYLITTNVSGIYTSSSMMEVK